MPELRPGKHLIVIAGGIADRPIALLNDRTALEAAKTVQLDKLARKGLVGTLRTIPNNFIPGAVVAFFTIFGYDPKKYRTGHAPFVAKDTGVLLDDEDIVFTLNTVTLDLEDRLADATAGGMKTEEARVLLGRVQECFDKRFIRFICVEGGEHLMVVKKGGLGGGDFRAECVSPRRILGEKFKKWLPKGEGSDILSEVITKSRSAFGKEDINKVRIDLKENPASMLWPWGQGAYPRLEPFADRYGPKGCVLSRQKSFRGFGYSIGMEIIDLPSEPENLEEEYQLIADLVMKSFKKFDIAVVYLDESRIMSIEGKLRDKVKTIETLDRHFITRVNEWIKDRVIDRALILTDAAVPIEKMIDTAEPIPFLMAGQELKANSVRLYSEKAAMASEVQMKSGKKLIEQFLIKERSVSGQ